MTTARARSAALALLPLLAAPALANEGKWTPQQVRAAGADWLQQQGMRIPLDRLWDPVKGDGLLANAIQLPGCSASFISADGLLVTNHHCVMDVLQQHSTPARNLVADGFLAAGRDDERPGKAMRAQVPRAFRDVTAEVLAAVPKGASDLERFRAIEGAQKRLVAACEAVKGTRCQFHAFDGGLAYGLTEFEELTDLRLVWAPPGAVGDFGGETDNWTWPRHTGDFSLLRAWKDGQPYRPRWFFPVSTRGVRAGDAVAVLGYPGTTWRSLVAEEMAERQERWFPAVREVSAESQRILEEEGARAPEVAIAAAADLRGVLNRRKNAEGQLAGLARGKILDKQRAADVRVEGWADRTGDKAALAALRGLRALAAEREAAWARDFLLDVAGGAGRGLAWSLTLARRAHEAAKPDAAREPGFQERDLSRLRDELARDQQRWARPLERRLLLAWVKRALALPPGQRLAPVDASFGGLDEAALAAKVAALVEGTALSVQAARLAAFDEPEAALRARKDPLLDLGLALDAERRAVKQRRDGWAGAVSRLRPAWRKAVIAEAGRPVAPDANRSLRVTFGVVMGYTPRDAVRYQPQTTLAGMVQKHTGAPPFDVPAPLREAAAAGVTGRWVDPVLHDLPIDFLADCDTTGGNSGSPTIDADGKLVGVNFDRVWENVANDFGYVPDVARNVNADVRFLLWLLERQGAGGLLGELGVQ